MASSLVNLAAAGLNSVAKSKNTAAQNLSGSKSGDNTAESQKAATGNELVDSLKSVKKKVMKKYDSRKADSGK